MYKKVSRLELRFFISAHHLIMLYILPSFTRISQRVSELFCGHYFPTKIGKRAQYHQKYRRINGSYSLHITCWCFIFVPNIMKVPQKVSQLLSRHICFLKGHDTVKIVGEVTILVLCLMVLYICTKFKNVSKGLKVIKRTRFPY